MRNHLAQAGTAVFISALAIACAGGTNKVDNAWVDQGGGARGQNQRIKLEGCVQAAPGNHEFALKEVYVPPPAEQTEQQDTMEHPVVSSGSWVRLTGGTQNLNDYLGQRVKIIGNVEDSGVNTIGTSGRTTDKRAGRPSSVPPPSADANGNAPLIAVEKIDKLNQECSTR